MSIIESLKPHTIIKFKDDEQFTKHGVSTYLNYWNLKQGDKQYFSCCVDTSGIKDIDIIFGTKQAMIIAKFIKQMKKQKHQYLKYTILVMPNIVLCNLLDAILQITKPCATLYIVNTREQADNLYQTINRGNEIEINAYLIINEIKYVKPK